MNRDLGSITIVGRRCRLGLLEFRFVLHFVIIPTDNSDEEGLIAVIGVLSGLTTNQAKGSVCIVFADALTLLPRLHTFFTKEYIIAG